MVPVASGSQLTKVAKGFRELYTVGLLDEEPHVRISGAQAEGCSPVAPAFQAGRDVIKPVKPTTIAKSLAIGDPADGVYALDEVRRVGGSFGAVTDEEIVDGIRLLARTEGIFAETAGGVTIATLAKLAASGVVRPDERVVAYVTGNGLKTIEAVAPACFGPATATIAPHPGRLRRRPYTILRRFLTMASPSGSPPSSAPLAGGTAKSRSKARRWPRRSRPWRWPIRASATAFSTTRAVAPLRQRVRRRRGHPLPRRGRHSGGPGARVDRSGGGRRMTRRRPATLSALPRLARLH